MFSKLRRLFRTSPSRPRACPRLEPLEDRTLPATRVVVPLGVTPNNTTTFVTVHDAFQLNQSGLAAGDVIQIEPGSIPGALFDSTIRNLPNLTLQGDPAFTAADMPPILFRSNVTVTPARLNFTLRNLQ